ncbi:c-type cytochrome biogenesis protein CcmI [Gymnodinialimonas ceratoperidinii]|uniref:C-type cytochrome biogenesis protein CcmI n=1 Tax=Gymnodinialimonas ceratoperidinii TaxID=2856823 RepID=A0A8F6TV67_9RHOB|nr:c-type cytochrome biogenesis protein CcmI [Gymnodinialimonas ceratoperidinii]QXT38296.1 c-type cytochrome biogenesis protein CcmI [Gymnodinialimonas ceratoperidinii]
MAFWLAAGFISIVVAGIVFLAARRPAPAQAPAAAYDLQVYRDQLAELDRDVARGTLSDEEASRARTEVSRRILDADRALQAAGDRARGNALGTAAIGAGLIATIVGAGWLYTQVGAPGYPDMPLQARIATIEEARANRPAQATAEAQAPARPETATDPEREALVAQLREVMAERPDDTQGLTLLAANEAMLGNFTAAHTAQAHLIDLLGSEASGRHYIDLAEMMIFAAGGYISPEAEQALRAGLALEPRDGTGRYYAGEMYAQQGRPDLALPIWTRLLADSRPEAPWVLPIQQQIEAVASAAGVDLDPALLAPAPGAAAAGGRGPSPEDIAAMEDIAPEDRQAMITSMVEGLADRLAREGGPPEDWARLITAYGVLGRVNAAQIVHDDALSVFADAPDALALIENAFRAAMARAGAE